MTTYIRKPLALINEVVFEDDVQRFCQDALAGELYDKTALYTGISREHAKKKWYQLAFSIQRDFRQGKDFMANTYPSIVRLLDQINAKESVLPKMLQRLESRLMLDGVARFLVDHQIDFLPSIHDSFFYFRKDEALVEAAFQKVFGHHGLQLPHYK